MPGFYRGASSLGRFPMGGAVFMIFILALVALVIVLLVRNSKLKKRLGGNTSVNDTLTQVQDVTSPETILKDRLAKGEITADEFDSLLSKINE